MYKTYTDEALVCGSVFHNTSDKNYLLFCKNGGMLWATARSVREERSKQRYAMQDFSLIKVSLVKGRSGWRIGSVEAKGNPFMHAEGRTQRGLVHFVVALLRRYVHGEVQLPRIFDDARVLLTSTKEMNQTQHIFTLRLLYDLGYIAPEPQWRGIVEAESIEEAFLLYTKNMEIPIEKAIKKGEEASHL